MSKTESDEVPTTFALLLLSDLEICSWNTVTPCGNKWNYNPREKNDIRVCGLLRCGHF